MVIRKNQSGVVLLAVIFLMVVIAFIGVMFLSLSSTNTTQSVNEVYSSRALYIAEGGLARAGRYLIGRDDVPPYALTSITACTGITGNANFTNVALGAGQFTVAGVYNSTAAAPATLSALINAADLTIPVNSVAGYAPYGRIMIDREMMNYTSLGTTAAACLPVTAPCFLGVVRGVDGTTAIQHAAAPAAYAAKVSQVQCTLSSTGGVPSMAVGTNQRMVNQVDLYHDEWAVGVNVGGRPNMAHWDGTSWTNQTASVPNNFIGGGNLVEVSMLSPADGWAVSNNGRIIHWNGVNWTLIQNVGGTLTSVYMNSSIDGWAVGNGGVIYRWNGITWAAWPFVWPNPPGAQNLRGVSCLSASYCWAVGTVGGGADQIINWNGVSWTLKNTESPPGSGTYRFVTCVDNTHCWAVGTGGEILFWSGGLTWAFQVSGTAQTLNGVDCVDANNCWAVGNSGTIRRWNGVSWAAQVSGTGSNLQFVDCVTATDCWAVGAAGVLDHWNGTTWALDGQSGVVTASQLTSASMVFARKPEVVWQEVVQ